MLQGNLTKLDNDFITIWSNYVLYREIDKEALRKLAEMGQINAVQSYYLFFNERNTKVDEIANGYKGINPDENFAKTNKLRLDRVDDIARANKILVELANVQEEIVDLQRQYDNTLFVQTEERLKLERQADKKFEERKELETEFYNIPFIKMKKECVGQYWQIGLETKNPLFCERAVELQASMPLANIQDLKKCVKITRKGLMKHYKKDMDNVGVQFALAKNLIMFRASDKEKEFANNLLKNLSKRELSQEVQKYDKNHTIIADEKE